MRALALLLALLAASSPAGAADPWTPAWKMIAGDGSVLPSDCIGSTETLDCFIDTLAACSAWSESPQWRADDTYFDAPICAAVPSFKALAFLNEYGPAATQLHLYSATRWQLEDPSEWTFNKGSQDVARAGDTVLDVYTLTCSPNPGCLESLSDYSSVSEVLTQCPRTACFGASIDLLPSNEAIPSFPFITLLVRKGQSGWAVVDWYDISKWRGTEPWGHWKRK